MTLRVLVTGSRDWKWRDIIADALKGWWVEMGRPADAILVHGAASGADSLADDIWSRQGLSVEKYPVIQADWVREGRRAGPLRNARMVGLGADVCFAFILNRSRGASGCADLAEAAGIRTVRYCLDVTKPA